MTEYPLAQPGLKRMTRVYEAGMAGMVPVIPLSYEDLKSKAKARLKPEAFDYVAGGAGGEETVRSNGTAFTKWRIVPRMLRDVSSRHHRIHIFDQEFQVPVFVAPIGVQGIIHPEGEVASAKAAASLGVPYILSSASSKTLEEVAQAMGDGQRWFQLYWSKNPDIARSFIKRAEAAGYSAIVVTLDTNMLGWRERDLARGYLPFLRGDGVANYFSDPAFRAALAVAPEVNPAEAIKYFLTIFGNVGHVWTDLATLRAHTNLPILLKGILHPEDAVRAIDMGMDGVIVSNHGGRQVDGAIAALDALPAVVDEVRGRIPVLFDSGIRRGADAFKAMALGARAILYGRPWVYGLALEGEIGVREALINFLADLDCTFALAGKSSWKDVGRDDLASSAAASSTGGG
jgi:lactate 2-monooxygenase